MYSNINNKRCVIIRPPSGYGTGNKPNIREGLYLLPQALPNLARTVINSGAIPDVVDLEVNNWNLNKLSNYLENFAPDAVFITVSTPSYCYCKKISEAIRGISKNIPIVMGGPHATYKWKEIIAGGTADYIILGEGEHTIPLLLEHILNGRPIEKCIGVAYRSPTGHPTHTAVSQSSESLCNFGIPAYECIDMDAYKNHVGKCTIEIVRGCPHSCKFCLNSHFYPNLRYKKISNVIEEFKLLTERYGFNKISIISPELIASYSYSIELFDRLEGLLRGTNVTWACATTAASLSKDILEKMAKGGCRSIFIGIESLSAKVQNLSGVKISNANLIEKLSLVKDFGIDVIGSFIIGLPGENEESARQTIDFASELRDNKNLIKKLQFNTFGPFPGTEFRKDFEKYKGKILPIDYAYYAVVPSVEYCTFTKETHFKIWHETWKVFFPDFYNEYLDIEKSALESRNPMLEKFCN